MQLLPQNGSRNCPGSHRIRFVRLEKPYLTSFSRENSGSGTLNFLELPHEINRVYFIKSVSIDAQRGFHAHRALRQIFFAPIGSFEIALSTPYSSETFTISSNEGMALIVPPGYWRVLSAFSEDSVCMVLASDAYDPNDYIRDQLEYKLWFGKNITNES